jgi:hypothetical protein
MRLMNILNSPEKISGIANLFNGGWEDVPNSQTSISSSVIYFLSLVSSFLSSSTYLGLTKFNNAGSAVAVKQIFLGGRDTISLHCASLIPNTIRVLMSVKQCLRLAHISLQTDNM